MTDPLLALKFPEEYFGFIYQRCGEEGLRRFIEKGPKTKEELNISIEAMEEVGLTQVAAILKEYLPDAPPKSKVWWCTYDEHRHQEDEDLSKCYWHRQKQKCQCRYDREYWKELRAK
jgi:hypothetical protein